jgi:hypothetical protein
LAIYALVLKFRLFLSPLPPVLSDSDSLIYRSLIRFLDLLHFPNWMYSIIVFLIVFIQALLFNRVFNLQKMFPRLTDLPAMAYLLVTSLLPQWDQFSAPLLINSILIAFFYRVATLNAYKEMLAPVFNLGMLLGLSMLLFKPAVLLIFLFMASMLIIRPFYIREWLLGLMGILTPYYFAGVYLFLAGKFSWPALVPTMHFTRPVMPASVLVNLGMLLLVILFMIGGIYLQQNLSKMLIQARKNWNLVLLQLVMAVLIVSVSGDTLFSSWILGALPLAAFLSAAFYFPQRKMLPAALHWILFIYSLYLNYWL